MAKAGRRVVRAGRMPKWGKNSPLEHVQRTQQQVLLRRKKQAEIYLRTIAGKKTSPQPPESN